MSSNLRIRCGLSNTYVSVDLLVLSLKGAGFVASLSEGGLYHGTKRPADVRHLLTLFILTVIVLTVQSALTLT